MSWTNARAADCASNVTDCLLVDDGVFDVQESSSKDNAVSFNRRGLSRLPPDFSSICSSLVVFSCSGNSLKRLDFGAKSVPHLRQLDCR